MPLGKINLVSGPSHELRRRPALASNSEGFDPFAYGTVLAYWDFTDAGCMTLTAGRISQLKCKTGNLDNTLVEAGTSDGPNLALWSNTGFQAAQFNGTSMYMTATAAGQFNTLHNGTGGTVVAWFGANRTGARIALDTGGHNSGLAGIGFGKNAANFAEYRYTNATAAQAVAGGGITSTGNPPFVVAGFQSASAVGLRINTTSLSTGLTLATTATNHTTPTVGRYASGALQFWSGFIGRIVVYSSTLTGGTIDMIRANINT